MNLDRYKSTRMVAVLGITVNIVLLAAKMSVGLMSKSQAMIADALNSAGDIFASIMTFLGNKIASRPEDEDHPYGHGKAEFIFAMIISFSLIFVAYKTFRSSLDSILNRETFTFSWWLVGVAVFTIVLKAFLFVYVKRIGKKQDSLLILANSEDHRNDVIVTSAALVGIALGNLGFYWMDGTVGVLISLWIAFTGFRIFRGAYLVLMDTNIDDILKFDIMQTIKDINGVDHVDSVVAKPIGVSFLVIVKVSVHGGMSVSESHIIAAKIRQQVKTCRNVNDVVVHINPV